MEIKGVGEALRRIREKGKDILDEKDIKVFQASNFLQQEIQESIIGARAEPRSVLTGNFVNSIKLDKLKDFHYSVFTDVEYAKFLEYRTSKMAPRSHFRNSLARARQPMIEVS